MVLAWTLQAKNSQVNQMICIFFKSCSIVQAVFASCIPEILELVGTRPKYGGEFRREHGKRYPVSVAAIIAFRLLNVVDCLDVILISPLLLSLSVAERLLTWSRFQIVFVSKIKIMQNGKNLPLTLARFTDNNWFKVVCFTKVQ